MAVIPVAGRFRIAVLAAVAFAFCLLWASGPLAADASAFTLDYSKSSSRSAPAPLQGATVSADIYAFVSPQTGATGVKFWLDNTARTGTPTKTEGNAPWDFAGTAGDSAKTALPYDTRKLTNGAHTITAEIAKSAGGVDVLTASFTVDNTIAPPPPDGCTPSPCAFSLQHSTSASRTGSTALAGKEISGNAYIFVSPTTGATSVRFWLDNPSRSGTPFRTESGAPFDFGGTAGNGTANPYDTKLLSNGSHSIQVEVTKSAGGTSVFSSTFTVTNVTSPPPPTGTTLQYSTSPSRSGPAALNGTTVSGNIYAFVPNTGDITSVRFYLDNPTQSGTPRQTESGAPYDFAGSNSDGTAKPFATTGVTNGSHTITAAVVRASGTTVTNATFTVANGGGGGGGGTVCTPVPCSDVLVELPYALDWSEDHAGVKDKNNVGTGFTWVDKPTNGTGYIPANLDASGGQLKIASTSGLSTLTANSLDNALAVGIDAPSQITDLTTTVVDPPAGTGNFEQGGLWFGNGEKTYVKLVVISTSTGLKVNFHYEANDAEVASTNSPTLSLAGQRVTLRLIANPTDRSIEGKYRIGSDPETSLGKITVSGEMFSFDAAGIDPTIGTRSFGGVFASHRLGPSPVTYAFDDFTATGQATQPPPQGGLSFTRTTVPIGGAGPTAMAWGPDNRLYVAELFGKIHAISFTSTGAVAADQTISSVNNRLTLGLAVDPASTPSNVILWAVHSNPSTNQGQANSGILSKLTGASFATRQDVITGLPRAIANHGTNSIHFGADGKLYIAQGGNTGAGAPNSSTSEFGQMQEQPLSAALLVADVNSPTFDGTCNNTSDIFGPPPCSVQTYATGMRNMYDFVFHSNGSIYGSDNGLGVAGTFPPSATPPCKGFGDTRHWTSGGDYPGSQPDLLYRIQQGKYYGHPNPYRDECVFKDGHFQGVGRPANFVDPLYNLGDNRSANGMIEYTSEAFCGALKGELLIANYSVGDDITRIRLSPGGTSVASATSLIGQFNDPLPLTQAPDGRIFVGELGAAKVTALTPTSIGCWRSKQSLPVQLLDAGGAGLGGKLYVVGGKDSSGHKSTVHVYNPTTNVWSAAAPLPGPAVENPAVVPLNGKLYVFGGSTEAFAGAVRNGAVYDPATNAWTALPLMATGRGGPTAQAIGNKIYLAGGMDATGASLASVEVFDTTTNTWSSAASMGTRRDNPGSAVFNGKLHVFGGRTRNADGTSPAGTLNTHEMYDPATNAWTARASMPTGRRTMAVGTLNGRVQVMGGEITPGGGSFSQNEEYDPGTNTWRTVQPMQTPRHGAAAGTINGAVYVAGGGPTGGFALSSVNEAFTLP